MNGFLLDTNVISKFAPGRPDTARALQQWMLVEGAADRLFVSAITIAEIERGIRKLHRKGGHERADRLTAWLEGILLTFEDRIIAFDAPTGRIAGAMADHAEAHGQSADLADVMIAATAKASGLTVVTENVWHFEPLDVPVLHPPQ